MMDIAAILDRCWRRDSHLHGDAHWRAVTATGLDLVDAGSGADRELVFLFGLLHDSRRVDDGVDPQHGPRAAAFVRELHAERLLGIDGRQLEVLCDAIEGHSYGSVSHSEPPQWSSLAEVDPA